jgi:hypothetical protein
MHRVITITRVFGNGQQERRTAAKKQTDASHRTRAIAEAMRLKKGDALEWIFDRGDLIVRKG